LHWSSLGNIFISVNINIHLKPHKNQPMRRNSTSTIGALHPILFFILVYGISVCMALFVCRAIYIRINGNPDDIADAEIKAANSGSLATTGVSTQITALR
jgi:hypothetical protein